MTYSVKYEEYYEPYVIISQKIFVPYDERFRGYGMNKCIQLKELSMNNVKFRVIKQHFLIASQHEYSTSYKQTYSKNSKFRRFVIAKLYQLAKNEFKTSQNEESLSNTTKELMKSNTEKNYMKIINKFIKKMIEKKEKQLKEKLTFQSTNNINSSLVSLF